MLAWQRTGLVLMVIGFGLDKLGQVAALMGARPAVLSGRGRAYGLAVAGVGLTLAVLSVVEFMRQRSAVEAADFRPRPGIHVAMVFLAAAGGVGVLALTLVIR
jgi:uncharacterized membrane protein YidH (DUF202 family)